LYNNLGFYFAQCMVSDNGIEGETVRWTRGKSDSLLKREQKVTFSDSRQSEGSGSEKRAGHRWNQPVSVETDTQERLPVIITLVWGNC